MTNFPTPNAERVQATRTGLEAYIVANYPEVTRVKVKQTGWFTSIRAYCNRRRIRAMAKAPHNALIRFIEDLNQKVYLPPCIEA